MRIDVSRTVRLEVSLVPVVSNLNKMQKRLELRLKKCTIMTHETSRYRGEKKIPMYIWRAWKSVLSATFHT